MKIKTFIGILVAIVLACVSFALAKDASPATAPGKANPDIVEVEYADKYHIKCVEYMTIKGKPHCSTRKLDNSAQAAQVQDKSVLKFDGRPWAYTWGQEAPKMITVEYLVKGDNLEDWKELITSQFMPSPVKKIVPLVYSEFVISTLSRMHPKLKTQYHVESTDEVIFEFQIAEPDTAIQDEIQRVVSRNEGLYVYHYVIKKADMGDVERKKWLGLLKLAKPKS